MKIYIAGPITAPTPGQRAINVVKATDAGIDLIKMGHTPFIPHLFVAADIQAMVQGRPIEYETWMALDDRWLTMCDALLYLAPSPGADRELARAQELGLTVFMSIAEVPHA